MHYDNSSIRRQDRLLDLATAKQLLHSGEYGVLSLATDEGAYGIPINFVWNGAESIYLHCAPEGRKLRSLARDARVSFCVVGHTRPISDKFTTEYESIVASCRATVGLAPDERMHALELLLGKYSPDDQEVGMKYAEKSFHRTEVIRLDILSLSGKCKRVR